MLLLPHLYLLLPALVPGVSTGTKVGQGICHVTRRIQHAVVLYISRMSSQPPPTPPAPVFNGHPHSLFPRMLGGAQFGMQEVEGTAWRRPLCNSQVQTSRAEPPSPPHCTCMARNLGAPHQLHSLQQGLGDTEMRGEQEGLRFALWFPVEAF